MAVSGKNALFKFGTTWGPADCLQGMDISDSVNDVVYQCNGYDRHVAGTRALTVRVSMALPSGTATSVLGYIYPGAESTEAWFMPQGRAPTTKPVYTPTRVQCNRADVSAPINGIITADFEFGVDSITISAATT